MVSVALVGLGDIGRGAHLPALLRSPGVRLVAVADPVAAHRSAAASLVSDKVAVGSSLDDALAAGPDGVVLATPPWATPELAIAALRAGRFVLAEKPVATSVAAASVYLGLTDDERARLQIGLTYRHDPAIARLKSWIDDGVLGGQLLVRAHVYDEARMAGDAEHLERMRRTLAHGTPVVHEGAHVFDWLAHLLGPGLAVDDAWALRTDDDLPAPNLTGARLSHPGGHQVLVEFGWLTDALPRCELTFLGPRGLATLDGATFALRLSTAAGSENVEFPGDRSTRDFDLQVDRFTALIRGDTDRPDPDLAAGLAALALAEQVAEQGVTA
ncbi:Gfo/Idh/MocA family protein [Jiangella anatolica]|uniref:Gfo/Idh/MocA family oxidoreductase n=1 Tax=Jiangella anatolica TaxID=2670374 RepID=A0A2W2BIP3_9ACTN|nr:Gfo/Idh/MocA family oxidoreductase [Jiangella anatolica]PZF80194.1 gfo/Idh/MocA family oxidoreductase [Jiangella anatolica]